jgi:predicted PurR-regulated permease PerM
MLADVVLIAALAWLLWKLSGVLLLLFSSIVLAVALRAAAAGLARGLRLPVRLAVIASALLIFGAIGGVIGLYGVRVLDQYHEIFAKVRETSRTALIYTQAQSWGPALIARAKGLGVSDATDTLGPLLGTVLTSTARYLTYAAIVIVGSVFLALDPERYVSAAVLLAPRARREALAAFLASSGEVLRQWLISRLIVMAAIGVMVSIGLTVLRIDAAITLGLTGALLTFIPFIGALLAMVPAVLVALTVSPFLAIAVALMFWAVHFIEGAFITPMVQDEQVALPPVVTIFSTLAFTVIAGPSGVILASPLVLVMIEAVRIFYLEGVLGEPARTATRLSRTSRRQARASIRQTTRR